MVVDWLNGNRAGSTVEDEEVKVVKMDRNQTDKSRTD